MPRALGLPRDPVAAARQLVVGRTRRIGLGRANGRRFGFAAGVGLDAELIRRMDSRGRRADGKRPGDAVFAWTAVKTLAETRVRFDPALEVEGHGRAAFALVANADPYTYLGRLPLRLPRGARLEGGLDLLAPRSLRIRSLPGAVRYLATGRTRLPLVELHDADRIVDPVRRAAAAPARRRGPRRRHGGLLRGRARRRCGPLLICGSTTPVAGGLISPVNLDMSHVQASTADMRPLVLAVLFLLMTGCTGEEKPTAPSPAERDVRLLARELQAQHPDLFHDLDREEFRGTVDELADDASELSRDQLVVGLMRLAAMPGERDGHTAIYPFDMHPQPLHVFPIRLYHLAGGLYALAAVGADEVVGRRLISVAGRPVDEVVELVRPLVPHDNESSLRWLLPEYVTTAEVLRGLGVTGDGPVEYAFEGGVEAELEAEPAESVAASVGSALAPPPTNGDPTWLRNLEDSQWLTTLEGGRVVYLGYRITTDDTYDVAARLNELASPASVRRVIVDVRLNHGGNNRTYGALLEFSPALRSRASSSCSPAARPSRPRGTSSRTSRVRRKPASSASLRAARRASGATRYPSS